VESDIRLGFNRIPGGEPGVQEDFKVIEEYVRHGRRRFRVLYKKVNVVFNVVAESVEEALDKARRMAERVSASRALRVRT
jgi:alkanesulfonate monooxygenase SsuD/methylene tetrahydromethanopterin reductase-like flavin-dependent oxidoreductase (luciferase family)